jgi:hypothetical protein
MQNDDSLSSHGRVNLRWEEMNAGLGVSKMHVSLSQCSKIQRNGENRTSPISSIFEKIDKIQKKSVKTHRGTVKTEI